MKIVVCVKAVPASVEPSQVIEKKGFFSVGSRNAFLNESDEYAVEEALALKRQWGGEVTAITLGVPDSQEALYKALAKGVDRAVRIDAHFLNPARTARALASALKRESFDLILTGVESSDVMASFVGGGIAANLKIPFAFSVTGIERRDERRLIVTKEIGGGRSKKLEIALPALLSVQTGICSLTYTSYRHIVFAKRKPVGLIKLSDLNAEELAQAPEWDVEAAFIPQEAAKRSLVMLEGEPKKALGSLRTIVKNKMAEA